MEVNLVADMEVDMVADIEMDIVANMEVDMVANMEVDTVADMVTDKEVHKMMNEVTKNVNDIVGEENLRGQSRLCWRCCKKSMFW